METLSEKKNTYIISEGEALSCLSSGSLYNSAGFPKYVCQPHRHFVWTEQKNRREVNETWTRLTLHNNCPRAADEANQTSVESAVREDVQRNDIWKLPRTVNIDLLNDRPRRQQQLLTAVYTLYFAFEPPMCPDQSILPTTQLCVT